MYTSPQRHSIKQAAAAIWLASIVAVLLTCPTEGFVQAGPARAKGNFVGGAGSDVVSATDRGICVTHRSIAATRRVVGGGQRKALALETSDGLPRGPAGAIKLTYLELNSWMWEVNGINLLVDPLFGTLDFGVPLLFQGKKRVLSDSEAVTRELAAVTDFLVISQGFDDHCHPPTLKALSSLLKPSVRLVAPPSAQAVLEEYFPASRITYLLPGQSTALSAGGRSVEVRATSGSKLGPPWQQVENGYVVRPVASGPNEKAPDGGSLYYEPHANFDEAELSELDVDVAISPVVQQNLGPFPLVRGMGKTLDLVSALSASKLVTMANSIGDFRGPLGKVISAAGSVEEFLELAKAKGITVVVPEPAKAVSVWP